jgi:RNA polymerase sigma-70 factor, ECF subfamily
MEQEFLSLVKQHNACIHHACKTYARSLERDDMVQEILAAAWVSFKNFKNSAPFPQWFYGLCRNVCVSHLRKHVRRPEISVAHIESTDQDYSYEIEYDIKLFNFYNNSINSLHSIERKYMEMYLTGMPFKQMERITGVDENSLRVRVHRIKKRLKQQYKTNPNPFMD